METIYSSSAIKCAMCGQPSKSYVWIPDGFCGGRLLCPDCVGPVPRVVESLPGVTGTDLTYNETMRILSEIEACRLRDDLRRLEKRLDGVEDRVCGLLRALILAAWEVEQDAYESCYDPSPERVRAQVVEWLEDAGIALPGVGWILDEDV